MPDGDVGRVLIFDTTLRDGAQREGLVLSLQDKLRIARALDEFGMPAIEGGWPGSNPKDIEFFAAAKKIRWERAKLAAFGSTRHKSNRPEVDANLNALLEAETPIVTIFGKSWTLHVDEVIEATRAENLAMIAESLIQQRLYDRAEWCLWQALRIDPTIPRLPARLEIGRAHV